MLRIIKHDEEAIIRSSAAEALGNIGDPSSVKALIELLQTQYVDPIVAPGTEYAWRSSDLHVRRQ